MCTNQQLFPKPVFNSKRFCLNLLIGWILGATLAAQGGETPLPLEKQPVFLAQYGKSNALSFTPTKIYLKLEISPYDPKETYSFVLVTPPQHGTLVFPKTFNRDQTQNVAIYTAHRDYVGQDSFTWKGSKGNADSKEGVCAITVVAAPPLPHDQAAMVLENTPREIPATYWGGGGFVTGITFTQPEHGTLTLNGTTFLYTPAEHYAGTDAFTWQMTFGKDANTTPAKSASVTCYLSVKKPGLNDWPQWRADEFRSAFTTMSLPEKLYLQWQRELPASSSSFAARGAYRDIDYCRPVQLGKHLYVPDSANDSISAYDTDSGELHWRYYASGAIRRPPAAVQLADGSVVVIVASDDGYVYALNGQKGSLRWKFRAAPNNRKVMGFGRLSSPWPIWASPVISEGLVYFAAGYIPTFGLYAYALNVETGAVAWTNDGRIRDMWNTSALGPLSVSYDHKKIFGSVEGACRPWVVNRATGEFEGHAGVGFSWPGGGRHSGLANPSRNGSCGWYSDGTGAYNVPEPLSIKVGSREITPEFATELGVKGTVASMLAGDGKLFVTTAEGGLYCFGGAQKTASQFSRVIKPLPDVSDEWTATAKAMLSRDDRKQGLALVLGISHDADCGRLVEELAKQSSLMVVAVDPDGARLQAIRAKMDEAGILAARVSTLEGQPSDFQFAKFQAALITSENSERSGISGGQGFLEKLYNNTRPFGGEIWIPTTQEQDSAWTQWATNSKRMALSECVRQKCANNPRFEFSVLKRTGLPAESLRMQPPFELIAFGCLPNIGSWIPLSADRPGLERYSWLPLKAKCPGAVPPPPEHTGEKGYPTLETVRTSQSIFTAMVNPLYGQVEKFQGVPSSGNDGACSLPSNRYGDYGLTHGKLASIFDASSDYWGRLFFSEAGGCPGRLAASNGVLLVSAHPVPGSACGCSAAMQFSDFAMVPVEDGENWVSYQTGRTSNPVDEQPIRNLGVNFGALGDRFEAKDAFLWSHHPYAGRYGRFSYNQCAEVEALPLAPVTYKGTPTSVYRPSTLVERTNEGIRAWVSASHVEGMEELTVHLAQTLVAARSSAAPKLDGVLDDACWTDTRRVYFTPNHTTLDPNRSHGIPKTTDMCHASFRYDDENLYIAAGTNVALATQARRFLTITLNSRERAVPNVVLNFDGKNKSGMDPAGWACAFSSLEEGPLAAEASISWKALAAAGLWKNQLIVNVNLAGSQLVGQFAPLFLDTPRGFMATPRTYTVRLYFAEMDGNAEGQRTFDVALQGKPVLKSLDVAKETGGRCRELTKEFTQVEVLDNLTVGFTKQAGIPMLSGIEIRQDKTPLPPNVPPVPSFEATPITGAAPLKITLNAQTSSDEDGQVVECAWDLGDGRLARGSTLEHIYSEPGTYKVHLLVRDNRGAWAVTTKTISVTKGALGAFVCSIRKQGGDFAKLSDFEKSLRSDLTSTSARFKVGSVDTCVAGDFESTVTFAGGATGVLKWVADGQAFFANISGSPKEGKVVIEGGHSLSVADAGEAMGKSLLFSVKNRGTYAPEDCGTEITFAGGGKGTLRLINHDNLAYITECKGTVDPGSVRCASGHTFETGDAGTPIISIVADCFHDWPDSLADTVPSGPPAASAPRWITDAMHSVTIRSAQGQGHRGAYKSTKQDAAGFTMKGSLDLRGIPYLRLCGIAVEPEGVVSLGKGASATRVLSGDLNVSEAGMVASCMGNTYSAKHSRSYISQPISNFSAGWRDGYLKPKPPNYTQVVFSNIGFYNCTAATFDPAEQAGVTFINCLARPGGKGFSPGRYADLSLVLHCVSCEGSQKQTSETSISGEPITTQSVEFMNAAQGDYHLAAGEHGAAGKGGPGFGLDIDGDERSAATLDVGADARVAK